jgi:hypothetical protein
LRGIPQLKQFILAGTYCGLPKTLKFESLKIIRAFALETPVGETLRKFYPSAMTYFFASDMIFVIC